MDTEDVAGVAGLPEASNINGCDGVEPENRPAKTAGNPSKRRTFERGHVYFVAAGKHVKIGFSTAPLERLKALQTSHPETLEILHAVPGTQLMERSFHKRFAKGRVRGEWFLLSPEVRQFITWLKRREEPKRPKRTEKPVDASTRKRKQPTSPEVVRLHMMRLASGAETPRGHLITGILEGMESLRSGYDRPEWARDARQTLPWVIAQKTKRLEALTNATNN